MWWFYLPQVYNKQSVFSTERSLGCHIHFLPPLPHSFPAIKIIEASAQNGEGMDELKEIIERSLEDDFFIEDEEEPQTQKVVVTAVKKKKNN